MQMLDQTRFENLVHDTRKRSRKLLRQSQVERNTSAYLVELIKKGGIQVNWPADASPQDTCISTFIQLSGDIKVAINKDMVLEPDEEFLEGCREHFSEIRNILSNIGRLRWIFKYDWVAFLLINVVQVYALRNQAFFYYSAGIAILVTWFFKFLLRRFIVWRFKKLF